MSGTAGVATVGAVNLGAANVGTGTAVGGGSGTTGSEARERGVTPASATALLGATWAALQTSTMRMAPATSKWQGVPAILAPPVAHGVQPQSGHAAATPPAQVPAGRPSIRAAPLIPVSVRPLMSEETVRAAERMAGNDRVLAVHVRAMALYDDTMRAAAMMPDFTEQQKSARNAVIADARARLGSDRKLTATAITRIDALLNLPPTDPTLGVE